MAMSRRGANERLPSMTFSSCRTSERDPVALVESCHPAEKEFIQNTLNFVLFFCARCPEIP